MKIFIVIWILSCAISVSGRILPPQYEADDEELPPRLEDVPDKYYDILMQEIPELREIAADYPARRDFPSYKEELGHRQRIHEINSYNFSKPSVRRLYQVSPDKTQKKQSHWNDHKRGNWIYLSTLLSYKKRFPVISCYWCGMNLSHFVPTTSICHDAFESSDYRVRGLQRFFRGKCYRTNAIYVKKPKGWGGRYYRWWRPDLYYYGTFQSWNHFIYDTYPEGDDRIKGKMAPLYSFDDGLRKNYFGQYSGGCFKRYLDVGTVYTQRGCRHYWPKNTYGDTSVAHRFKKLEYVLRNKAEGCISVNHASLTPFNRGISLFARYHVCVCSTKYCNQATNSARLSNMILSVAVLLTCSFNMHRI